MFIFIPTANRLQQFKTISPRIHEGRLCLDGAILGRLPDSRFLQLPSPNHNAAGSGAATWVGLPPKACAAGAPDARRRTSGLLLWTGRPTPFSSFLNREQCGAAEWEPSLAFLFPPPIASPHSPLLPLCDQGCREIHGSSVIRRAFPPSG